MSASLDAHRQRVDDALASLFRDAWPAPFADMLRYPLSTGGKRIRPLLCFAACEAVGGSVERAEPAALAVELVHTYSLVHDDLPCMDDDDERRGRPTLHKVHGQAAGVLVGDALLTEAFGVVVSGPHDAGVKVALVERLVTAAGYLGMVGGQAADVGLGGPVDDIDTLMRLHKGKTGALIAAAVALGGLSGGATAPQLGALETYGRAVGLAFQLADDVLDADEDAGADGPPSYVKLLGRDETLARAQQLRDQALEAIRGLPSPGRLGDIARFVVDRDH